MTLLCRLTAVIFIFIQCSSDIRAAEYGKPNPVSVFADERAGETLGFSGDVGYSNIAHLHFSVHRAIDGERSESIPVRFRVSENETATLKEGLFYKGWEER
ncbi:MAG TPA: hypothetical protein PK358_05850 [Spirochaetota bacterium]|nr:hypothetical protein [Spirochaetota bacterium]HPJ34339.1 hypothetical protein [Spirochaetota bacterium]